MTVHIVNAFSKGISGGSPTGVVLDATKLTEDQMQLITDKVPASHTAFIMEPSRTEDPVEIRFFTKGGEIVNCGHGTIAAHYLRSKEFNYLDNRIFFQKVKEGLQQIELIFRDGEIEVYLKQNEIIFKDPESEMMERLLEALGLNSSMLNTEFPYVMASPGASRFLLCVKSIQDVNIAQPDFVKLKQICHDSQNMGCFLYSLDDAQRTATARMFAPSIGVNEDVINGNSSGCLGAYIAKLKKANSLELMVYQGHKFEQDGVVLVRNNNVGQHVNTVIGGRAVIRRQMNIPL